MKKILLLEDDIEFAEQLIEMLNEDGYAVTLFTAATPALKHLEDNDFDAVIADIFIRKGDELISDGGVHLIAQMKQFHRSAVPIIAISGTFLGRQSTRMRDTAKVVGADAVLAKPFAHAELAALLSRLLG